MQSQALTPFKKLQLEFWTGFRAYALNNATRIRPIKATPGNCMNLALGRTDVFPRAVATRYKSELRPRSGHEIRAELVIACLNSKQLFEHLASRRGQIERDFGEALTWSTPEEKPSYRAYLRKDVDLNDRNRWPEYHAWLVQKLDTIHRVFRPIVKKQM